MGDLGSLSIGSCGEMEINGVSGSRLLDGAVTRAYAFFKSSGVFGGGVIGTVLG